TTLGLSETDVTPTRFRCRWFFCGAGRNPLQVCRDEGIQDFHISNAFHIHYDALTRFVWRIIEIRQF
ncbi:hypothetical protein DPEC_G00226150, partial [Dallia pectoralis]